MPGVHPPTFTQPYTEQIPPAISQLTAPPQSADRVSASVRSTAATHPTAHTPAGRGKYYSTEMLVNACFKVLVDC